MTASDFDPRIRKVISGVFGVPEKSITDASGPDSVEGWDSLQHIHLIVALEAEFAVSFEPEQAIALTSVPAIRDAVTSLGAR